MKKISVQEAKDKLRKEGLAYIYEWRDEAGKIYPPHSHRRKVSMYIVGGSIHMKFPDRAVDLKASDYLTVPVATEHSAVVGEDGCEYVVGEEIQGDS